MGIPPPLPYNAHVPSFHISYYFLTITLVSAPISCSPLVVPPCSHARGILCWIHTSCTGSPFPSVHTRCSLVFSARCYLVHRAPEPLLYYYCFIPSYKFIFSITILSNCTYNCLNSTNLQKTLPMYAHYRII